MKRYIYKAILGAYALWLERGNDYLGHMDCVNSLFLGLYACLLCVI